MCSLYTQTFTHKRTLPTTNAADSATRKWDVYSTLNPNWSLRTGVTSDVNTEKICPNKYAHKPKNR